MYERGLAFGSAVLLDDAVRRIETELASFAEIFYTVCFIALFQISQSAIVVGFCQMGVEAQSGGVIDNGGIVGSLCSMEVRSIEIEVGTVRLQGESTSEIGLCAGFLKLGTAS